VVKQIASQFEKHGSAKASWYCEWNDPDGKRKVKSCGAGMTAKRNAERMAERMAERIKAELLTGTYSRQAKTTWADFRKAYSEQALAVLSSSYSVEHALDIFEKITKLKYMVRINTNRPSRYKAVRREQKGRHGSGRHNGRINVQNKRTHHNWQALCPQANGADRNRTCTPEGTGS
jgi:hypothetical protein